jgi:lipase maturation factor 1
MPRHTADVNSSCRVRATPAQPVLLYDGDCRFCALWVKRWRQTTGDQVEYLPAQDAAVATRFPEISRDRFDQSVQFVETDGQVYSGAQAVFRLLATNPKRTLLLRTYQRWTWFASVTEAGYRFVATRRPLFSKITRLCYGERVERPEHLLVRSVFLRAMGLIYLAAFVSLWTQMDGLIGSKGILPTDQFMAAAQQHFDQQQVGWDRYRILPTLSWGNASDAFLHVQCGLGVLLAVLVVIGIAPAPCLFLLWLIYLSLATVGRVFLGFQWDNLLLEAGLLAIIFAPAKLFLWRARENPPSRIVLWLLRLLLFKLMFLSGVVKLQSGDALWQNWTALTVHYETQPLPTWLGWYAHQLPVGGQKFSCAVMFGIELLIPFLIFAPRRPRICAAALLILLQVLILLTGNYTFFNWLTIVLCVPLLDDFFLRSVIQLCRRRRQDAENSDAQPTRLLTSAATRRWRLAFTIPLAIIIVAVTTLQLLGPFRVTPAMLQPVAGVYQWLAPLRSVNSYGLFAVMTPGRPEIILEGSNDGVNWQPYEFKYKPGDLKRRPGFVAPHQPRLDWQMWFAALGSWQHNPWLVNVCQRLLEGSPEVLALLEANPFPDAPPRLIRATVYDYRFTNFAEKRETGNWWRRENPREYLPPVSLRER